MKLKERTLVGAQKKNTNEISKWDEANTKFVDENGIL
jgi:hypothetical protein